MKKICALFFVVALALLPLAGCAGADAGSTIPAPATAPREAAEPVSPQQAIAAATTPEELRALITTYQTSGDNESVYLAAKKLLTLDPADTQAYQDAIAALLGTISGDYQEIQSLVTLGIQNAPDGADAFARWAAGQNQAFSFTVPFVGDYTSEAQINPVGITPGNLTNTEVLSELWRNGLLTTQGDWVYFMLPSEDYYVYKMKLDGTGMTKVGDARGDNLNIVGDWLYYRNLNDQDMIYRIRTDGTQKEGPIFNKAVMMSVTKDWIYYCDRGLFKTKTDGSETVTLVNGSCDYMALDGDWIYYNTGGDRSEFYRISTEGGQPQKLLEGWTSHFAMFDGWMYFTNNVSGNAVCRMRPDGSEQTAIYSSDDMISFFNLADGKLAVTICKEKDDRGKPYPTDLIIIDLATNTVLKSLKQSVEVIYSAGDSFYYRDDNQNWHSLNPTTFEERVVSLSSSGAQPVSETPEEQKGPSGVGNTSANLFMEFDEITHGTAAMQGDVLYFANPRDNLRLYTATQNGGANLEKLLEASVSCLNVAGNTIYYRDKVDNFSIYSVGTDGQNSKKLSGTQCEDLSYADGWLYYRTNDGIFKLPAEGGEATGVFSGKFRNVYANAGWVYYIEDHEIGGLWRIPVDGGEPQPILTDHPAKFYAMQGDLLYCLIDGGDSVDVIRMNLDGSEQQEVFSSNEKVHAINISGNRLLVVKAAKDGVCDMILVWDLDKKAEITTMENLTFPNAACFGSDVYFVNDEGFVRQNLDTGERTLIAK